MTQRIRGFEKISQAQFEKDCSGDLKSDFDLNDIKLPKRATSGSAGHDFFIPFDIVLKPMESIKVPTCIRAYMKDDEVLEIYPRSSHGFKFFLKIANTVGIIDSDYYLGDNEGHIWIKIRNEGGKVFSLKKGEAFCQGIFKNYLIADNDATTNKRTGGIGSTSN